MMIESEESLNVFSGACGKGNGYVFKYVYSSLLKGKGVN